MPADHRISSLYRFIKANVLLDRYLAVVTGNDLAPIDQHVRGDIVNAGRRAREYSYAAADVLRERPWHSPRCRSNI